VRLAAHARPFRRGPGQVQFGLDPACGVVLDGLDEAEVGWLLTLEPARTSRSVHNEAGALLGSAVPWGVTEARAAELVRHLRRHRLVDEHHPEGGPRDDGGGRSGDSRGRVGAGRVCVLGVGRAAQAVREHLAGLAGSSWLTGLVEDPATADVAVLVIGEVVGARHIITGPPDTPHLPVVVQAHRVVVGPLVDGRAGPCLRCLHHYRRDRDHAWPALVAQVDDALQQPRTPVDIDPLLSGVTAGLCAMVLHAFLDGGAAPEGVAWEVSLPWPRVLARRWARHPACRHHQPAEPP